MSTSRLTSFLLPVLTVPGSLTAQNLVPNGDFEAYSQCPDYVSQIDRAAGWMRPTNGTSDYLNACLGVPFSLSVPDNQFGDQPAHSGGGYAGFYCFYSNSAAGVPGDLNREYVTRALASPLVPGATYAVEFHVSLADVSKYAVDDIGLLFSTQVPYRNDDLAITAVPQISHGGASWLADKAGWTRISGCFMADSAYTHLTIGNFHDGAGTNFTQVATNFPLTFFSYYYVDDVSVTPTEAPELGPDLVICAPTIIAVEDPQVGTSYTWSTGESGTSILIQGGGTFIVHAERSGCILTDTLHVHLGEPAMPFTSLVLEHDLCRTAAITIALEGQPLDATVSWSHGPQGPTLSVDHAGTYTALVEAPGHCPVEVAVLVNDLCAHPFFLPNAFTPNGDGLNDVFLPVFDPWTLRLSYAVFDRWGREVHRDPSGGDWTGAGQPVGIYELRFRVDHLNGHPPVEGTRWVALIR